MDERQQHEKETETEGAAQVAPESGDQPEHTEPTSPTQEKVEFVQAPDSGGDDAD